MCIYAAEPTMLAAVSKAALPNKYGKWVYLYSKSSYLYPK